MKDHYKNLGLGRDSSIEDVKIKYRKLAKVHHPDKNNGDEKSEEKFKEILDSYTILSNPHKKELYDIEYSNFINFNQHNPVFHSESQKKASKYDDINSEEKKKERETRRANKVQLKKKMIRIRFFLSILCALLFIVFGTLFIDKKFYYIAGIIDFNALLSVFVIYGSTESFTIKRFINVFLLYFLIATISSFALGYFAVLTYGTAIIPISDYFINSSPLIKERIFNIHYLVLGYISLLWAQKSMAKNTV